MKNKKRIDVSGQNDTSLNNPFASLESAGLPRQPPSSNSGENKPSAPKKLGRVDIRREKAGRAGKEVTVISGDTLPGYHDFAALAKELRNKCGVGGTEKSGKIELQGDQREKAAQILEGRGFRVVFAGG